MPFRRHALFLLLASLGCYADLLTKRQAFSSMGMPGEADEPYWLVPRYVGIQTSLNTGGLFGLFENGVTYLAIFSCFALAGLIFWFVVWKVGHDLVMTWILGLITGGILGNLYDRFGLWSQEPKILAVRDWILFQYSDEYRWPNFNIADSLLVCGAVALFVYTWKNPPDQESDSPQS